LNRFANRRAAAQQRLLAAAHALNCGTRRAGPICHARWLAKWTIRSARAIYLGSSLYRIHGSNEPDTIGAAVSSGCIRMTNRDVVDLSDRVTVGTKVVVIR
jgi:hypothetical protein